MAGAVLALNAGSSSMKFGVFATDGAGVLARGTLERSGDAPRLLAGDGSGATLEGPDWSAGAARDAGVLLGDLLGWVDRVIAERSLMAVGHRVVHGGREFTAPVRITAGVLAALEALTPLAPLHQTHSLSPVRAMMAIRPALPQVACFDTAFHRTMTPVAARFALDRRWEDEGVRRYGFHGLSYEFVARRLRELSPRLASGRTIVAHLGNGASLCAMRAGESVDTTMSFTALDGLVMGTRCGTLDPGVVLYMMQHAGMSADAIERELYERSGLLGVSGEASDMRALLASGSERARDAMALFAWRIGREAAALAGSLGGLDGFVFTGGIGEHGAAVRDAVAERLRWLGPIEILVVPTDEETMIARHVLDQIAIP